MRQLLEIRTKKLLLGTEMLFTEIIQQILNSGASFLLYFVKCIKICFKIIAFHK